MSRTFLTVILLFAFAFTATELCAEQRTWKSASGGFTVEAELVDVSGGEVVLRRSDDVILNVPISKLSEADQQFVIKQMVPTETEDETETDSTPDPIGQPEVSNNKYDNADEGFWAGYRDAMRQLSEAGDLPSKGGERLKRVSSWAPESMKHPDAPKYMLISALVIAPFAYVWLLIHEYRASVLWLVAQLSADLMGSCFFPLLGAIVFFIFAANNFADSWKPILLNLLVMMLIVGTFVMIPTEVYSGINPPEPPQPQAVSP